MLRYLYGHQLDAHPRLRDSMFRDRAEQFRHRLGWDVSVNENGEERDRYDDLNPLYVIWENAEGLHGGSMRLLPTMGPTIVNDHFGHLLDGVRIESPLIWECTRFCLSFARRDRRASAALVLGAGEVMRHFHLAHFVAVFDARMERIYRRLRVAPEVLGSEGEGAARISVGLWEMKPEAWRPTLECVGVSAERSRAWLARSLQQRTPLPAMG
jgi:acyl homoserine lactone synthase